MDLPDLIVPMQRALAPPGQFFDLYPDATDDDLEGYLQDAVGRAQLLGFFASTTVDATTGVADPTLSRAEGALLLMLAAREVIKQNLLNLKTHVRYEAPGVVFEEDQLVSLLVSLLAGIQGELNDIIAQARLGAYESAFYMVDAYVLRAVGAGWEMPELSYLIPVV